MERAADTGGFFQGHATQRPWPCPSRASPLVSAGSHTLPLEAAVHPKLCLPFLKRCYGVFLWKKGSLPPSKSRASHSKAATGGHGAGMRPQQRGWESPSQAGQLHQLMALFSAGSVAWLWPAFPRLFSFPPNFLSPDSLFLAFGETHILRHSLKFPISETETK